MRIVLMHYAQLMFEWPKRCNAAAFDAAWQQAQTAEIRPYPGDPFKVERRLVYVGTKPAASLLTAQAALVEPEIVTTELLDEIPLRSFEDTPKEHSLGTWVRKAHAQQRRGDTRQFESKKESQARAEAFIELMEGNHRDCIVVSGGEFLSLLISRFQAHGYNVQRSRSFAIEPLERIKVTKLDDYCGGCVNMCLLAHPGCGIGQERANEAGVDWQ